MCSGSGGLLNSRHPPSPRTSHQPLFLKRFFSSFWGGSGVGCLVAAWSATGSQAFEGQQVEHFVDCCAGGPRGLHPIAVFILILGFPVTCSFSNDISRGPCQRGQLWTDPPLSLAVLLFIWRLNALFEMPSSSCSPFLSGFTSFCHGLSCDGVPTVFRHWERTSGLLFSGSFDNTVKVWDIGGCKGQSYTLRGHKYAPPPFVNMF